jgi:hypothetical protein
VLFTVALLEWWQGRLWWCPAGDWSPWSWTFFILGLLFPRVSVAWRLAMAVGVEGCWEAIENTAYVINRYREVTISLNYFGDSIVNSLSDIVCCACGFLLARWLRFWRSAAVFLLTEVVLILTIHDSLTINVIQLLWPSDTLRDWQNQ